MTDREYYRPQEVADMLGVKILTVYRWIKEGKITAYKVGQWRIPIKELDEVLKANKTK